MLELHIIFHGRVQGVGFRAAARRLAEELKLTGYARNLPDHSVEILVQGKKEVLEAFLLRLKSRFSIDKAVENYQTIAKSYTAFKII